MRSAAIEEAMVGLSKPSDSHVKHLVDTFERLLSLAYGDGREAWGRGARRKNKATATTALLPATLLGTMEIDVSYRSIASSSEVSFPAIVGIACIVEVTDRTRF